MTPDRRVLGCCGLVGGGVLIREPLRCGAVPFESLSGVRGGYSMTTESM